MERRTERMNRMLADVARRMERDTTRAYDRAKALWALVDAGATCAYCGASLASESAVAAWRDKPVHRHCAIEANLPARVNPCCYRR